MPANHLLVVARTAFPSNGGALVWCVLARRAASGCTGKRRNARERPTFAKLSGSSLRLVSFPSFHLFLVRPLAPAARQRMRGTSTCAFVILLPQAIPGIPLFPCTPASARLRRATCLPLNMPSCAMPYGSQAFVPPDADEDKRPARYIARFRRTSVAKSRARHSPLFIERGPCF